MRWNDVIQKFFGLFFVAGIILGYLFSETVGFLGDYVLYFLGTVITLAFLNIDYQFLLHHLKRLYIILLVFAISKIAVPVLFYFLALPFDATIALALFLVGLTPVAIISPTLTQLVRGDSAFILMLVVVSLLLAPLYMPLMMYLVAGSKIQLELGSMMITLGKLIVVPFFAALVIKRVAGKTVPRISPYFNAVSVILITILIMGIVAKWSFKIRADVDLVLPFAVIAYLYDGILALFGYFGHWFLDRKKRVGLVMAILYMNLGLSIVIASEFLSPEVLLFCVVFELPVNTLPMVVKRLAARNPL